MREGGSRGGGGARCGLFCFSQGEWQVGGLVNNKAGRCCAAAAVMLSGLVAAAAACPVHARARTGQLAGAYVRMPAALSCRGVTSMKQIYTSRPVLFSTIIRLDLLPACMLA